MPLLLSYSCYELNNGSFKLQRKYIAISNPCLDQERVIRKMAWHDPKREVARC